MKDRLIMLPPKGRIVLAPHDDTSPDVPRIIIPEDVLQPPIYVPAPTPAPTPQPDGGGRPVIDISKTIPRLQQGPAGQHDLHDNLTYHWLGYNFSRNATDAESVAHIIEICYQHQRKGWGPGGAPPYGDTIMYHEAITPLGTVYVLRDYSEVAWHAGNDLANRKSRGILVMCGPDTPPTARQIQAIAVRYEDFRRVPIKGHQEWTATQCPGPTIMQEIRRLRG